MNTPALAYLALGAALLLALVGITAYYYSRKRRAQVEQAKYAMLDDDVE